MKSVKIEDYYAVLNLPIHGEQIYLNQTIEFVTSVA